MKLGYRTLLSVEINKRPDTKFRQGFIGTSVAAGGSENKLNVPLLLPCSGVSSFLIGVRIGAGPSSRRRAGLGGVPTPSVVLGAEDMSRTLLLLPTCCFCS